MILNAPNCSVPGQANTGYGSCVIDFGRITGVILIPKGTEIAYTDLTSFKTSITNGIYNNSPLLRYYPVLNLVPNADNTGDVGTQTYPDGTVVVTTEGKYDWTFDIIAGKFCLGHRLRKHNKIDEDVLLIDEFNQVWGTIGSTPTAVKGYTPTIKYQNPVRNSQGTDAVTAYRFRLSMEPTQLNDFPQIIPFNTDSYLKGLKGLQDVSLLKVSRTTNVLVVTAFTSCGTVNMYDSYSTALNAVGAWVVTTLTGADQSLTSVALNANNKGWTLTLNTSDPDYIAGADVLVKLVGPATLKATPYFVDGFESNEITVGL